MQAITPFSIIITTYEVSQGRYNPTITHIFHGQTLEEAQGNASAHLITDFFFSSSFVGSMPWQNSVLYLDNTGRILGIRNVNTEREIFNALDAQAREINQKQKNAGMVLVIRQVSQ